MEASLESIDWQSEASELRLNPRWPREDQRLFAKMAEEYLQRGHLWICSSGSTSSLQSSVKLIALSKAAFLASAQAVNARLHSTSKDVWALSLPLFHVGGLSILARAHLSGAAVMDLRSSKKWQAEAYYKALNERQVSLGALVPTQLSDLVELQLSAPASLRALVIGGAALPQRLYKKARSLGWPVLPSFGMTEACSQIATAELSSLEAEGEAPLVLLNHLQARVNRERRLSLKGESLLTGYAQLRRGQTVWVDPKEAGWFETEDHVDLQGKRLSPLGRGSDFIQVGGETVNLLKLGALLEEELPGLGLGYEFELAAVPCERLGAKLVLVHTAPEEPDGLITSFNEKVLPYERIRESYGLGVIPRTDLKKIRSGELLEVLAAMKPDRRY